MSDLVSKQFSMSTLDLKQSSGEKETESQLNGEAEEAAEKFAAKVAAAVKMDEDLKVELSDEKEYLDEDIKEECVEVEVDLHLIMEKGTY